MGEGVVLTEGHIDSGGSRQNWETTMSADSEFEVKDIPRAHLDFLPNSIELVKIIENDVDTGALLAERERIKERLEEINAILSSAETDSEVSEANSEGSEE